MNWYKEAKYKMKTKTVCMFSDCMDIESAYNSKDDYIGDEETAKLLEEKGIEPELANSNDTVCSIGFCEKEQKWYGWSHRAIKGFGIGDKTSVSYPWGDTSNKEVAKTLEDCKKFAINFADSVS